MGKIQVGGLVGEVRNKVGALIYSRNKGGAYTKAYAVPTNPNTTDQQAARFRFFTAQNAWGTITEAEREAWNRQAFEFPIQDNLGRSIQLSGYNLFIRLNLNLSIIGAAAITLPPVPGSIPALTNFGINVDTFNGQMNIITAPAVIPAGFTLVIAVTPALLPTQYYFKNKLRTLYQYNPGEDPNSDNIIFIYLAKFTLPTIGQKVGVKGYFINNATGEMGVHYTGTGVAT